MPELPPVVATIAANYEDFYAANGKAKTSMAEVVGAADEATAGIDSVSGSAEAASGSLERVGAAGSRARTGLESVAGSADAADAGLSSTAASGDAAAASMDRVSESSDAAGAAQERVAAASAVSRDAMAETGAAAGLMGAGATKGAEEVKAAESDAESHSGGFSSRVSSMFKGLGSAMGNVGLPFHSAVSRMGEDIGKAEQNGEGFKAAVTGIGKTLTVVGAAAVAGFAAESVHMADEFDVSQAQLRNAIENTGGSFAAFSPQIDDTYSRMSSLGFENAEVAKSMESLVIATRSPATAMRDMSVAADLARAKNISLEAATQTLTKVYAGSTRALTQLGLNLDIGTGKLKSIQSATESVKNAQMAYRQAQEAAAEATGTKAAEADRKLEAAHVKLEQSQLKLRMDQEAIPQILSTVQQRTEGASKAFGDTLAGQMKVAGAKVNELGIAFGEVLIPVLTKVIGVVADVAGWFIKGSTAAHILEAVIGGPLVFAMTAYVAVTTAGAVRSVAAFTWMAASAVASSAAQVAAWAAAAAAASAAFIAENAATLGIAAGIALLVTGVVYLVTHWNEAWATIKSVIGSAVEFVRSHLALVMVSLVGLLGPIGVLIDAAILLATKWKAITQTIASAASWLVSTVVGFFSHLPGDILSVIESIPGDFVALWHLVESGVANVVSGIVHFFATLPGKVVAAVEALPGDMLKLGEEIMQAIIHGVEKLAGAFASMLTKTILGPIESVVGAIGSIFSSGGGGSKGSGLTGASVNAATTGGPVEQEILKTAMAHGLSAAAAAGMVGNAAQESSLTPGDAGGGLYQMSGYPGSDSAGSAVQQTIKAIELMGPTVVAAMNKAGSAAEAAHIMEQQWEKPAGSQPGETATTNNRPHREQAAEEAIKHIKGAVESASPNNAAATLKNTIGSASPTAASKALKGTVEHTTPVVPEMSLKRAIEITDALKAKRGVANAIETAEAKKAAEVVKHAIETAKLKVDELKKALASAFSEFAKMAEEKLKSMLATLKATKPGELEGLEAGHEAAERAKAVSAAEAGLATARSEAAELEANAHGKLGKEEAALTVAREKVTAEERALADAKQKVLTAEEKLVIAQRKGAHSTETLSAEEALRNAREGVTSSEEKVKGAKEGVTGAQEGVTGARKESEAAPAAANAKIVAAQETLSNALYAVKVAGLKKEAAAEEKKIAEENAAKEAAFKRALSQLEHHFAQGKTSTKKAMSDIEKLLKQYHIPFGKAGANAGAAWVKEFEDALKKAARDSGALSAEIRHDLGLGLKIPGLAAGGIVTSPTLAVVGEGGPEAVIPLSGLSTDQPSALPSAPGPSSAVTNNNFNTTIYGADKPTPEIAAELYNLMRPLLQSV